MSIDERAVQRLSRSEKLAMTSRLFNAIGAPLIVGLLSFVAWLVWDTHDATTVMKEDLKFIGARLDGHDREIHELQLQHADRGPGINP